MTIMVDVKIQYQWDYNDLQAAPGTAGRQLWFVCVWQVKLCDPLVTHESYLSALRSCIVIEVLYKYKLLYFTLLCPLCPHPRETPIANT